MTTCPSSAATPEWRLECRDLSVRIDGRAILERVSLRIDAGECVTVIGQNGSGKTTLLLALLGLHRPAAGGVFLNGAPLQGLTPRQRGRFAAYVPQALEHVPEYAVYDFVALGRYPHAAPLLPLSDADHAVIATALDACNLWALRDRRLATLSGGERQKALLAAALAQEPRALFLDEPSTALDPGYQIELLDRLREWRTPDRAMVIVSHDLQLPAALGGRVVALRDGGVIAEGTSEEMLKPEALHRVYSAPFVDARLPNGRGVPIPAWNAARTD